MIFEADRFSDLVHGSIIDSHIRFHHRLILHQRVIDSHLVEIFHTVSLRAVSVAQIELSSFQEQKHLLRVGWHLLIVASSPIFDAVL
jgi:hypothetical protein